MLKWCCRDGGGGGECIYTLSCSCIYVTGCWSVSSELRARAADEKLMVSVRSPSPLGSSNDRVGLHVRDHQQSSSPGGKPHCRCPGRGPLRPHGYPSADCGSRGTEDDGRFSEQVTGIDVQSETRSPGMDYLLTFHPGCQRPYFILVICGVGRDCDQRAYIWIDCGHIEIIKMFKYKPGPWMSLEEMLVYSEKLIKEQNLI